ncbi:hypothetical protein THF5G08_60128 [Vibrio jasicida]|nr:hypothetical protein THF5G08_60128 [Vibrio jasicida]
MVEGEMKISLSSNVFIGQRKKLDDTASLFASSPPEEMITTVRNPSIRY